MRSRMARVVAALNGRTMVASAPATGAEHEGWSLHAGVHIRASGEVGRERLCRHVLRHGPSLERMSWTHDGRIAYEVMVPRCPTRTHWLLEPLQLLARITSLVPAPRRPLVRYSGVLSSASKWRRHIVPRERDDKTAMGLPSTPPVPARARYPTLFEDSQLPDWDVA